MKYLVFLVLTSVPLLALTVFAVMELGKSGASGLKSSQLKKQEKLAHSASQFAETTQKVAKELTSAELFNPKKAPKVEDLDPPDSLQVALAKWNDVDEARDVLERYNKTSDESRQEEIKKLEEFREKLSADEKQKKRFSKLLKVVDLRIEQGGAQIALQDSEKKAMKLFKQSEGSFKNKKYSEAVKTLDKLLTLIKDKKIDKPNRSEVKKLKQRAEYRRDWLEAEKEIDGESAAVHKKRIDGFLAKYPKAPSKEENEIVSDAKALSTKLSQLADRQESRNKMNVVWNQFQKKPHNDLKQLLAESQEIIEGYKGLLISNEKKILLQQLRKIVTNWAIKHFPKPPVIKEYPWLQEAITTNGKVLRGVFEREQNLWKHYINPDSANRGGAVRAYKLESGPQKSFHFRSIQQYKSIVSQLSRDVFSKQKWQELERLCGTLDDEFEKYKKMSGANDEFISFDKARTMAKEVLLQWTAMKKLKDK